MGISVDISHRGQGIGSYMVKDIKDTYNLDFIREETDEEAVAFYKVLQKERI